MTPGYYWVKPNLGDAWCVAELLAYDGAFYFTGSEHGLAPDELAEIGEEIKHGKQSI